MQFAHCFFKGVSNISCFAIIFNVKLILIILFTLVKALATLPLQPQQMSTEEEDSSPVTPLPLYQQRDNFYN